MAIKVTVHEHKITEMAEVGRFGNVVVSVYGKEGYIPHMHVKGPGFESCVEFNSASYFQHRAHPDKLSKKVIVDFDGFLSSAPDFGPFATNWEAALYEWNRNNSEKPRLPMDLEKPDYTQLESSKGHL
ncbi:MAG: hypothetical protein HUK21_11610 [Fibrobacteraceae bacterium]|nr:hypothetical protein [Fibrobacteraceae bacterium]